MRERFPIIIIVIVVALLMVCCIIVFASSANSANSNQPAVTINATNPQPLQQKSSGAVLGAYSDPVYNKVRDLYEWSDFKDDAVFDLYNCSLEPDEIRISPKLKFKGIEIRAKDILMSEYEATDVRNRLESMGWQYDDCNVAEGRNHVFAMFKNGKRLKGKEFFNNGPDTWTLVLNYQL